MTFVCSRRLADRLGNGPVRQGDGIVLFEGLLSQLAGFHQLLLQSGEIDPSQRRPFPGGRGGGQPGRVALVLDAGLNASERRGVALKETKPPSAMSSRSAYSIIRKGPEIR